MYFLKHDFFHLIFPCFPKSVTLVTAKKQHRCWKARARVLTRMRYVRARLVCFLRICD